MDKSVSKSAMLRHATVCALQILVFGGILFTVSAQGMVTVDVAAHIPKPPSLSMSDAACRAESEALARQPQKPPEVKPSFQPLFLSNVPLFTEGMLSPPEPGMFPRQPLSVTDEPLDRFISAMVQVCAPLIGVEESVFAGMGHMLPDTAVPLTIGGDAVSRSACPGSSRMMPVTVRPPERVLGQRPSVVVKVPKSAIDLRHQVSEKLPLLQVSFHAIPEELAQAVTQKLVAGVLDEAKNYSEQKLEEPLKKNLLAIMAHDTSDNNAYRAYSLLLADSAGTNDVERTQALLDWAEIGASSHDLSRLNYFTALHHYKSFRYDTALWHIDRQIAAQDERGLWDDRDRLLMLKALCEWGEGSDGVSAIKTVEKLLKDYPASLLVARALFLRSWVHLYCERPGAARAGFKEVIVRYPQSEFAERAKRVLEGMSTDN